MIKFIISVINERSSNKLYGRTGLSFAILELSMRTETSTGSYLVTFDKWVKTDSRISLAL
jgi:hypothetical protein